MAQIVYRGNLAAAKFPFVSLNQGRTIIVPQYDNVYVPVVASKTDDDKDRGIPQIYYCHNVMPSSEGLQSVGYLQQIAPAITSIFFREIHYIRSGINKAFFCHNRLDNTNWIWKGGIWVQINSVGGDHLTTVAYVDGETYIYFANLACYKYDFGTNLLVLVVLTGLTAADVIGITSAAGYLIAWSLTAVAWSSTVDPTDFTPSLITGAGGGGVQGARSSINICAPHSLGFIVYTDVNAVAAVYSGNARYPFNFREITGSGGCNSLELISWDSNSTVHYVYTSSGLQSIALTGATTILPELTDFLSGKHFEDFIENELRFENTTFVGVMKKKLTVVADRYLVFSYGIIEFTHALVFDLVTRRWGKLRVTHTDCFDFNFYAPELFETPREGIAFLLSTGLVRTVNFSTDTTNSSGVLVLGKFQYIRQRMLQMQTANIENITEGAEFNLYNLPSLNGKTFAPYELGFLASNEGTYRKYNFHGVGVNHTQIWIGAFNAVSFVLHFNIHGREM